MKAAQFDGFGRVLDGMDQCTEAVDFGLERLGLGVGDEVFLELSETGEERLGRRAIGTEGLQAF